MTIPFDTEDPGADKPKSKPLAHIDCLEQRSGTKQECSKDENLSEVITIAPVECVIDTCSEHTRKTCSRNEVKERSSKNIVMRQYSTIAKSMHHHTACILYAIFNLVSFSICKAIEILSDMCMPKVKIKWKNEKQEFENKERSTSEWILKGMCRQFHKFPQQILQIFPFLPQKTRYSNKEPTKPYADLHYEGSRFATFATFPDKPGVFVTRLAEAGYHYEGNSDEVTCHICGIKYKDWKRQDSPSEIHWKLSPSCAFVKKEIIPKLKQEIAFVTGACGSDNDEYSVICQTNRESGLPGVTSESKKESTQSRHDPTVITPLKHIATDNTVVNPRQQVGFSRNDTTDLIRIPQDTPTVENSVIQQSYSQFKNSNSDPETVRPIEQTPNLTNGDLTRDVETRTNSLGICLAKPKYQKYAVRSARIDSFRAWPKSLTQSPEEMTLAGFFFTGIEDHCRCFFCGGGLKNWEPYDRPWVEHARWYPNCTFVKQCKGEKFIKDVQENKISSDNSKHHPLQVNCHQHGAEIEQKSNGIPARNHPAVVSVSELGIDSKVINDAFRFLTNSGENDVTSVKLLEAIFQLEDAARNLQGTQQNPVVSNGQEHNQSLDVTKVPNTGVQSSENKNIDHRQIEVAESDVQTSIQSLEEENQNLRDQQTCKICLDEPIAIVFLPCGHLAACKNCAPALRRCPICRSFIKGTVKAILC